MPPAARIGDLTPHPGTVLGTGVPTVLIGGMPAAVVGPSTLHTCMFPGIPPHPPTPFAPGSPTVLIGGFPALRVGDMSGCGASILPPGCPTVMIA